MKKTYRNNNGIYQSEYDKLSKIVKSGEENELLIAFKYADELYKEYYEHQNNDATEYDENEALIHIKVEWAIKIHYIRTHIPAGSIMMSIMGKMLDEEVSVEMEMMYESMMNDVIEYVMKELHLYIRDGFKVEFEDLMDLCKYPEYRYVLRLGVVKGVMNGFPSMSLDELESLAKSINKYVKRMRQS